MGVRKIRVGKSGPWGEKEIAWDGHGGILVEGA